MRNGFRNIHFCEFLRLKPGILQFIRVSLHILCASRKQRNKYLCVFTVCSISHLT